jgi:quinate dehydrogenase
MCTIAQDKGWKIITGEVAMFWQGIEQQKVWLGLSEDQLPVDETLKRVSQQVKSDNANHSDPPE